MSDQKLLHLWKKRTLAFMLRADARRLAANLNLHSINANPRESQSMNPLTLVKRLQKISERETDLGVSEDASWHAKYKGSAYIFVGGLPFDLTEGDLLAVFAQYGEIVDVNLVRDKGTGKSRGFAFIAYEDQRSTTLAVDNLNGTQILGRVIRVDHVERYKKLEEEDEETVRKKREERGVCRAFQRGECTRGDACKFSHDEQRAANTGWGAEDQGSKWGHDKYEGSKQNDRRFGSRSGDKDSASRPRVNEKTVGAIDGGERNSSKRYEDIEPKSRRDSDRKEEKRSSRHGADKFEPKQRQELYRSERNRDFEQKSAEDMRGDGRWKRQSDDGNLNQSIDYDKREEKRSRRHESESYQRDDRDRREGRRSEHDRDSSSHRHGDRNDHRHKSDR